MAVKHQIQGLFDKSLVFIPLKTRLFNRAERRAAVCNCAAVWACGQGEGLSTMSMRRAVVHIHKTPYCCNLIKTDDMNIVTYDPRFIGYTAHAIKAKAWRG